MINFQFSIQNPFSKKNHDFLYQYHKILNDKCFEFNIQNDSTLLNFLLHVNGENHAGIFLTVGFVGYSIDVEYYTTDHIISS